MRLDPELKCKMKNSSNKKKKNVYNKEKEENVYNKEKEDKKIKDK